MESMYIVNQEKRHAQCPYCSYESDRKNNLKRHIITMHYDSSKVLECCGEYFKSKAALRDHVAICHKSGYRCHVCSRNFCRKALLRRHLTVHSGEKDFRCSECPYATSHKSNLERHQKIHSKNQRPLSKPLESILEKEENSKNSTCVVSRFLRTFHDHKKCIISRATSESEPSSQNVPSTNNNNVRKYETNKNDTSWQNKKQLSRHFGNSFEFDDLPSPGDIIQKDYFKTDKVYVPAQDLTMEKSVILSSEDTTILSSDSSFTDGSFMSEENNRDNDQTHSNSRLWQKPYKCHWCKGLFSSQAQGDAHVCRGDPIKSLEIPLTCIVKKNMINFGDSIKSFEIELA